MSPEAGILQPADPDRHVDFARQEIDCLVTERKLHPAGGVARGIGGDDGHNRYHAVIVGSGDPQRSARLRGRLRQLAEGIFGLAQDDGAARVKRAARLSRMHRRVVRTSSVVPVSRSSWATCWLTTALVMRSRSAARVNEPVSTTAAK